MSILDSSVARDGAMPIDSSGPRDSSMPADSSVDDSGLASDTGSEVGADASACTPAATRCVGNSTETCNTKGQWSQGSPCMQPTPDCAAGVCTCLQTACPGACADLRSDNSNCGACGLACSTSCTGGECVVTLATAMTGTVTTFTVDDTSIYWSDSVSVLKASLDGSNPVTLATIGAGQMAIDSHSVYWTTFETTNVLSMPLAGGAPFTIWSDDSQGFNGTIAIDSESIYWGTFNGLMKAPLDGGPAATILTNYGPTFIVADQRLLTSLDTSGLVSFGVDGGTPTTLVSVSAPTHLPRDLTAYANTVFWTGYSDQTDGTITGLSIDGGTPTTLESGQELPNIIVTDGVSLYWNSQVGLLRAPIGGGTPVTLVAGSQAAEAIELAVDSASVYWESGASLMKVTPK